MTNQQKKTPGGGRVRKGGRKKKMPGDRPLNGGRPSGAEIPESYSAMRLNGGHSSEAKDANEMNRGEAGSAKFRELPDAVPPAPLTILPDSFYDRPGVVRVAKELLGKVLVTSFDGQRTSGRIVEVEAYNGVVDRASHAWSGRRTRRTEVMFGPAGVAYVYLIYGIHHLFNVVTNKRDVPHAVLVRALEPLEGIPVMLERTGKKKPDHTLTRGPGNLSRALGLHVRDTGTSLLGDRIFIADDGYRPRKTEIVATPRIGVDYAGEDAGLPYRFFIKGNPYVSGPKAG